MWLNTRTNAHLSDEELLSALSETRTGIVVLDGPTGCGKTAVMRRLTELFPASSLFLAEDDFKRSLTARLIPSVKAVPFDLLSCDSELICIDDIDLLSSYSATQTEAAHQLSRAAGHALVVLSGILCRERISGLTGELSVPFVLYEYRTE